MRKNRKLKIIIICIGVLSVYIAFMHLKNYYEIKYSFPWAIYTRINFRLKYNKKLLDQNILNSYSSLLKDHFIDYKSPPDYKLQYLTLKKVDDEMLRKYNVNMNFLFLSPI